MNGEGGGENGGERESSSNVFEFEGATVCGVVSHMNYDCECPGNVLTLRSCYYGIEHLKWFRS